MTTRPLTPGERDLAGSVFGDAIDLDPVRVVRRKWVFFQPKRTVMAPCGSIHFHPDDPAWRDDFTDAPLDLRALLIHELVHVWQHQRGLLLPLRRHPFCRYDYALKPGQRFTRYGIEQQAEIVAHAFRLREGGRVAGAPPLAQYETLVPFKGATESRRDLMASR